MHPATPLPADLSTRPFLVGEAVALGVSRKRLHSADLWAPFAGVRVPVALGWDARLRAAAGLLVCPPGTCVTGLHAVAAAGLPVPRGSGFDGPGGLAEQPLLVALPGLRQQERWSRTGFAPDAFLVPVVVQRVRDGGVLRLADPDLWARTVARPELPVTPRGREAYGVQLGAALADGVGPAGSPAALELAAGLHEAVLRLPAGLRHHVTAPLLALRWLLGEDG